MYTETGLLFPYFQYFSSELHQLEEYCKTQKPNASMQSNLLEVSSISEYDLGGEGDLFKAPEPIVEEAAIGMDPMEAAISMISCEDSISSVEIKSGDVKSLQNEQLLNNAFYECEKNFLGKEAMEAPSFEILDIKIPVLMGNGNQIHGDNSLADLTFLKSVSSESLSSMDRMRGTAVKPAFLDFLGMDFSINGMRRAYSEGDVTTLGNPKLSFISEERQEKLWRYRNKKTKRKFGRKIKYACRKALADSQPRIRGRFAKTEMPDAKRQ